ncbi:hypothetical protein TPHA_0L01400 [Tetrapisispora phaffii CBS 4417]|uniref:Uncharacterized protein n=1 Tax=Tetrapisispora phaffii (strain ATCC 24235 / CBS 4417 / NBRC 1672 / NRRL Y-8282 / UCD 70-5) TaxID=1071381 RepID=G8C017_TETPH|nr:hypothetical protein TPHA_0L01400 [Tetrapisispora phaffii CBS 4417]CCE65495.1 hypothetical protein TPHA_0L01400 [Tetrapisispora phaffii CBS 4417]
MDIKWVLLLVCNTLDTPSNHQRITSFKQIKTLNMRVVLSRRVLRFAVFVTLSFFFLLFFVSNTASISKSDGILGNFQLPDMSQYIFHAGEPQLGSANLTDPFGMSESTQNKLEALRAELNDKDSLINQRLRKEQEFRFLESQNIESFNALISNNLNDFDFNTNLQGLSDEDILKQSEIPAKQKEADKLKLEKAIAAQKSSIEKPGKDDLNKYLGVSYANVGKRPKACFLFVLHQHLKFQTVEQIVKSVTELEEKFNSKFRYPYVFIAETEFTPEEKQLITTEIKSKVDVQFGVIPKKLVDYPEWIDQNKAAAGRSKLYNTPFGSSESFKLMQRYLSGFLWQHDLLANFDWYWRIEPNISLYCDMQYDIFRWMQDTGSVYSFIYSEKTEQDAVSSIWKSTKRFWKEKPNYVVKNNLERFGWKNNGQDYNLCYFLSTLEVGNLNYWRSPTYKDYFDFIDHEGGIFYERWTDEVIRTLALTNHVDKTKIHFFQEIALSYDGKLNCPIDNFVWKDNNCNCDQGDDFTFSTNSCTVRYYDERKIKKPDGWNS